MKVHCTYCGKQSRKKNALPLASEQVAWETFYIPKLWLTQKERQAPCSLTEDAETISEEKDVSSLTLDKPKNLKTHILHQRSILRTPA